MSLLMFHPLYCGLLLLMMLGVGVGGQPLKLGSPPPSPPLSPSVLSALYSAPAGPWLANSTSNSNSSSPSVLVSTSSGSGKQRGLLSMAFMFWLAGGSQGYQVPASLMPVGAINNWCAAAGFNLAVLDTNNNPNLLPNHTLQLLLADHGNEAAKANTQATQVYSWARTDNSNQNINNSTELDTVPVSIVLGGISSDVSRSIATVSRFYNVPFVTYSTDSSVLPLTTFPTLLSYATSKDVLASTAAQFAYDEGWRRVSTLSTLAVDAVASVSHFALTSSSLNVTVSSREVFDESLSSASVTDLNPSLEAAIARLKSSDVRIMYLSCSFAYSQKVLDALDRAGMMTPKYVYLGDTCLQGAYYMPKPSLLPSLIGTYQPYSPASSAFQAHVSRQYAQDPDSLYRCDPSNSVLFGSIVGMYDFAMTGIHGLDQLQQVKQTCQQPDMKQRLEQVLPIQQVQQAQQQRNFDCNTAMKNTTWNTQLGIYCCQLDAAVRSPYYRPSDPYGTGGYVNGDGAVLLSILRSLRVDGISGPIGIQSPASVLANVFTTHFFIDSTSGTVQTRTSRQYHTTHCNPMTNVCTWNVTNLSPVTFGDGTTNIPDDGVIRYVTTITPSNIGRGIFVGWAVLGMLIIGVVAALMWHHRAMKSIKSSSITFVMLILLAAATALSTIITLYHDDQVSSCQARIWLGHVSFAVLFGSLLVKTYRLAHIFDNRALRVNAWTDVQLLGLLGVYVSVVCALLISWMVRHAPAVVFNTRTDGRVGYFECQSSSYLEMWLLLASHGLGLLWGIYLCIKSQDVFSELNESKQIALSIYNVSLLCAIIVGIDQGLSYFSVDITFYVYSVGILLGSLTTVSLLTAPKLLDVYRYRIKQEHQQRQQHAVTIYSDSHDGHAAVANMPPSGGKPKRLSLTGKQGSDSSHRVSDFGLGVTPTDWLKLSVFTRKCHEATTVNNMGRLMMAQNKLFALLTQIYNDATKQQGQGQHNNTQTAANTDTAHDTSAYTVASSNVPQRVGSVSVSVGAGVGVVSDEAPFDVNESGVRVNAQAGLGIRRLFNSHQQRAQQQQQQRKNNNHRKSEQLRVMTSDRNSIDSNNTNILPSPQQLGLGLGLGLGVEPLLRGPPESGSTLGTRFRSSSMEIPHAPALAPPSEQQQQQPQHEPAHTGTGTDGAEPKNRI